MTIIIVDDHGDWRDTIAEYIRDLGLDNAILTAGSLAELDRLLLTVNPAYEVQVREIIAALDKPLEQRVPETRPGRSDFIGPRAPSAP